MRGLRRATAVAACASAFLLASAAPGSAEEAGINSLAQCGAAQFCVWSATPYSGAFESTSSTSPENLSFSPVHSVWNRSSFAARVYSGSGGTGSSVCYAPGTQLSTVSVAAGSIRVLSTTSC